MVSLRGWQKEAFSLYLTSLASKQKSMLWEATPGAGKTTAALEVVGHQLRTKRAAFALIIVPTIHLRTQWAYAAARVGIQLDSSFGGNRRLSPEFNGIVVTYQQLSRRERWFKEFAARSIVVLDEVHHAGDGLSWGNILRTVLENTPYILTLSGTAFRSDSNPIPFVAYDKDGVSAPDYCYTYAQAVSEGVCRPTAFFTYGGAVSWTEHNQVYAASFSDALDRVAAARRLRSCLDPDSGWIQPMLQDAHDMLLATRKTHHQAGGLIVCADQTHARQIARLIATISREKPTIVLSDDSGASLKIKQFSENTSMWLVACNMVSEGVDIPRLRVGVYATTVKTKMYFRQFLGRIVRRQKTPAGSQVAYFYLPADPTLHQLAEEVEVETKHALRQEKDTFFDEERSRTKKDSDTSSSWSTLQGTNSGLDTVILQGNQLSLFGDTLPPERVQEVIEREVENLLIDGMTKSDVKLQLATEIKKLVGTVHRKTGRSHAQIHVMLNAAQHVKSQTYCSEAQLRQRILLLDEMLYGTPRQTEHRHGVSSG
jgi:superfamily II DNA or RNA helicase